MKRNKRQTKRQTFVSFKSPFLIPFEPFSGLKRQKDIKDTSKNKTYRSIVKTSTKTDKKTQKRRGFVSLELPFLIPFEPFLTLKRQKDEKDTW